MSTDTHTPDDIGPAGALSEKPRWSFVDADGRAPVRGAVIAWTYDKEQAAREARFCGGVELVAFDGAGYEIHREPLT